MPFSSLSLHRTLSLALVASAALLFNASCSGEDSRAQAPEGEVDPGAGGSGGDGGGSGSKDAGSDADGGKLDGGGGGSIDGGDGAPGDAEADSPELPVDIPPSDVACDRDVAFRSNSISFIPPTDQRLGPVLEPFLADADQYKFVLALRGSKGAHSEGALSAAEVEGYDYVFPAGVYKPSLASVTLSQGRFDSTDQQTGFLTFQDENKGRTIQLQNVRFTAFTQHGCQQIVAMVDATISNVPTNTGLQIYSGGQDHTLGDIAGMHDGKTYTSVAIRFVMLGDATNFDFSSLPM